tara:strand:- start:1283 stop:1459 length:177 start_codon:yes stop_codon:yes gene_type:complete
MADVAELKAELKELQFWLPYKRRVAWGDINGGWVDYNNQLTRIHALQLRIQRAEEAGR